MYSFDETLNSSTNLELFELYYVVGLLCPKGDKSKLYCETDKNYTEVRLNLLKKN